ncbi:MAG: glycosidase, partial [Planctomycetota bacterium]
MPTPAPIAVTRHPIRFEANDRRVIPRFFGVGGDARMQKILDRVHTLSDADVEQLLAEVYDDFRPRHRRVELAFDRHFGYLLRKVPQLAELPENRRRLIGAYFTMEYTIESAALFNPSVVPHPDQTNLANGALRFIMSLRATGEGHVSSIVFRTGVVDVNGSVSFEHSSQYVAKMRVDADQKFDKHLFFLKLIEMGAYADAARIVLGELPDPFTYDQLDAKAHEVKHRPGSPRPF